MKYILLILLAWVIDPAKIGKVNSAKSQAKEAYQRGEYKDAVTQYKILTDSLGVKEDEVSLNLAHSYFQLNDTTNAQNAYRSLTSSSDRNIKSVSQQQLGVMANRQGKFEEALDYFKNSLKTDPTNEEARYNYEMVKKKLEEKKKQEQQQKNNDDKKDDQKKDQKDNKDSKDNKDQKDKSDQQKKQDEKDKQNQDQKDQKSKEQQDNEKRQKEEQQQKEDEQNKQDKKETPSSVSEKLKEMKISEDKARMVLEAMKNQEVQYLQQNKRKATKPKSKNKPDW